MVPDDDSPRGQRVSPAFIGFATPARSAEGRGFESLVWRPGSSRQGMVEDCSRCGKLRGEQNLG